MYVRYSLALLGMLIVQGSEVHAARIVYNNTGMRLGYLLYTKEATFQEAVEQQPQLMEAGQAIMIPDDIFEVRIVTAEKVPALVVMPGGDQ